MTPEEHKANDEYVKNFKAYCEELRRKQALVHTVLQCCDIEENIIEDWDDGENSICRRCGEHSAPVSCKECGEEFGSNCCGA